MRRCHLGRIESPFRYNGHRRESSAESQMRKQALEARTPVLPAKTEVQAGRPQRAQTIRVIIGV